MEGRRGSPRTTLPRHTRGSRPRAPGKSGPDMPSTARAPSRFAGASPLTNGGCVFSADEQSSIVGPSHVVVRAIGIPRHHPAASAAGQPSRREHISVVPSESPDQTPKLWRRIPGGDDDARRRDGAASSPYFDAGFQGLDAARRRSLENARAPAGGGGEKSVARSKRVHLRISRGRIAASARMPALRKSADADSHRPGSPAAFLASNSFRSIFTLPASSVK